LIVQEHRTAEEICAVHGLNNLEIEYTDEDYDTLTNYRAFTHTIRPLVAVENPKVPMAKIVSLIGAKWREYIATHPKPELLEKAKKAKAQEGRIKYNFQIYDRNCFWYKKVPWLRFITLFKLGTTLVAQWRAIHVLHDGI
jgi:hypothetical protein